MPKKCSYVEVGQIVLFKLRGYCEWPALVTRIERNIIFVQFFGDQTTQKGKIEHFYSFEENHRLIIFNYTSKKNENQKALYKKAVKEAELVLGIPEGKSIMNLID